MGGVEHTDSNSFNNNNPINLNVNVGGPRGQSLEQQNNNKNNFMGSTTSSHSNASNATNPLSIVSASVPTSVSEMLRQRHMQR